jgi:spore germination protein Q
MENQNPYSGNQPQNHGGMHPGFGYTGGHQPAYHFPQHGYPGAQGQQPIPGAGGAYAAGYPSAYQNAAQQSYIENILRMNAGKVATVYMSFENEAPWANKVFKGVIEAAGKDHLILRDQETTKRYLLLLIYLDYVTFESEINYFYPPAPQFFSVGST